MNVWNEEAANFDEHWAGMPAPAQREIADALALREGVRVLDVGCGSGRFCALALDRGARVSGIDVAPAMLAIAGSRAPGADLCVGPMERMPWPDASFDAVTGFNSLQFAEDPVVALREWTRVARPGATIAICMWAPRQECELDVIESALRAAAGAPEPEPRFCERVLDVVDEAGLGVIAHETVAVPFEVPDYARLEPALLFIARAYGLEEAQAVETIRAAAAPVRRPRGSYPLENAFRYVLSSTPSPSPTRAPS
jgi:SAM-dependent methyltransferase